jgi:uncharacterized membrane protein YcaP (DUF421 family)
VADWFALTLSPWELVVRGSIIYLGLVLTVRFLLRRDVGSMSVADVLFIVLIADAAQNAMSGDYKSIGDGVVLVATLVAWNVFLDWLTYRSTVARRFLEPPALPLISDGKWVRANLKREWITTEEVQSKLREQGIEHLEEVKTAYLEPSGELGVIRRDRKRSPGQSKNKQLGT